MALRNLIETVRNASIAFVFAVFVTAPADALNFSIDFTIANTTSSLPAQNATYLWSLSGAVQFTQLNDDLASTVIGDIAGDGIGADQNSHLIFLPVDRILSTDLILPGDPLFFSIGGLFIVANFGWPSDPMYAFTFGKPGPVFSVGKENNA